MTVQLQLEGTPRPMGVRWPAGIDTAEPAAWCGWCGSLHPQATSRVAVVGWQAMVLCSRRCLHDVTG